jgi:hypothetical protein
MRAVFGGLLLTILLLGTASAQSGGTGQLAGRATLGVRGCGTDRQPNLAVNVTMNADGTWTAGDGEGNAFSGTWTPRGSSGRAVDLAFDAATEADLVATIVDDVGVLCDASGAVTVTATVAKRFRLKLNRRLDRAKLALLYVIRGRANNRSGSARYRIRAEGPFVPAG